MATGGPFQPRRGVAVSNVTPGIDFRTGEAEAWDEGTRLLKKYQDATKPDLIRRAQARGAEEGAAIAAGEMEMPKRNLLFFGDVAEARTQALQTAYGARVRTDIEAREAEVRLANRFDPEAYEAEMARVSSGFIQGAPPEFAVDVETYAKDLSQRGLEAVAGARSDRDTAEVGQALSVRIAKLDEDLIAMSAAGQTESFEFMQAEAERTALQNQREGNPAILYSTDQRVQDDEKLGDGMVLAGVNRLALEEYQANGRGMAGFAAATRFLQQNVLEGEEFADIAPGRRAKLHRDALAEIRAFTVADREEQRVVDEQERERRRAAREAADSAVLDASLGELGEADILARTDLDDAGKSRALSAVRSRISRERTEERAARAEETAGRLEQYTTLRDDADAGRLSAAEIAEKLDAGLITSGQAQTLRTRNDRVLKPLVDDVMTPVLDAMGRPGAGVMPDRNQRRARAEASAAEWVRMYPETTLAQRLTAGREIAERQFGAGSSSPGPGGAQNAGQQRAARIAAVNAQIEARRASGRPYSTAEANRLRNEAQGR